MMKIMLCFAVVAAASGYSDRDGKLLAGTKTPTLTMTAAVVPTPTATMTMKVPTPTATMKVPTTTMMQVPTPTATTTMTMPVAIVPNATTATVTMSLPLDNNNATVPGTTPDAGSPIATTPMEGAAPDANITTPDANVTTPMAAPEDVTVTLVCSGLDGMSGTEKAAQLQTSLTASLGVPVLVSQSDAGKCSDAGTVPFAVTLPTSLSSDFNTCLTDTQSCKFNNFPQGISGAAVQPPADSSSSSSFPIWAIIVIVVAGLALCGAIAYAVIRSRQAPSFGMSFPEQCGVLDEMEMEHEYKEQQQPLH